ncbi:hypothetical protein ABZS66_51860 [Dactylosporangium sp. NPDC005572]|uniref:hypothetical protein n=1 Tax=Dactylosporangium sp. NPDC005572 TaxID=3156889 RepID=UPI00339EFEC2
MIRRLLRLLPAALVLLWPVPAAAAPCTSATCYRYWADLTVTAAVTPSTPIAPGDTHSYTIRVTNTGWRTGGFFGPIQWPGPDSGPVWVGFGRVLGQESALSIQNDSGVPFSLNTLGPACGADLLPTGTTSQFTVSFRAPLTPGTYTIRITANSFGWTEYDETNNSTTLTYVVS